MLLLSDKGEGLRGTNAGCTGGGTDILSVDAPALCIEISTRGVRPNTPAKADTPTIASATVTTIKAATATVFGVRRSVFIL
jgi:hypothetical protein